MDQNLVERFSINIYHVLKNEFLITEDRKISPAEKKRKSKRRNTLLGLLVKLQEHIQQGIPVVGRFLTEYLEFWDGKSHFEHFLRLISQLQITDYKELHDCIISPIISKHFQNSTITPTEPRQGSFRAPADLFQTSFRARSEIQFVLYILVFKKM